MCSNGPNLAAGRVSARRGSLREANSCSYSRRRTTANLTWSKEASARRADTATALAKVDLKKVLRGCGISILSATVLSTVHEIMSSVDEVIWKSSKFAFALDNV